MKNSLSNKYIHCDDQVERSKILAEGLKENRHIAIELIEDLIELDLEISEQSNLIFAAQGKDALEFEDFLTRNIDKWDQNIASAAVIVWATNTDHLLNHRFPTIVDSNVNLPQRVLYTILDRCEATGGANLLEAVSDIKDLESYSDAFKGLLFIKSCKFNYSHKNIKSLVITAIDSCIDDNIPENKSISGALCYLAKFHPTDLKKFLKNENIDMSWRSLIETMCAGSLSAWDQSKLKPAEIIELIHEHNKDPENLGAAKARNALFGADRKNIVKALSGCTDAQILASGLNLTAQFFHPSFPKEIFDSLLELIPKAEDLPGIFVRLDKRTKKELHLIEQNKDYLLKVEVERKHTSTAADFFNFFHAKTEKSEFGEFNIGRKVFFNKAYRDLEDNTVVEDPFWAMMILAYERPKKVPIKELAVLARQAPSIFHHCYLRVLGQFKNSDEAVLKLLDFIRSNQQNEIREVTRSLYKIDTQRSMQELVACLTRPNTSQSIRLEIVDQLKTKDLSYLQAELRSAIEDLKVTEDIEDPTWDLRESLSSLLLADSSEVKNHQLAFGKQVSDKDLNTALSAKIKCYDQLSGESRRALRTSEFFDSQAKESGAADSIDLSPIIDMQYKCLELTFREIFEHTVFHLIEKGDLQKKLDIIGYARPIPPKMSEFETYISKLPIVDSIPFFSKFKLRKMLRAICQFKPGKRFTLDGLKAFSLFFLVFGRKNCRYGIVNEFPLPYETDAQLAEFCKELHMLQDFRNRATHEGFHPGASNDLDKIWASTDSIITEVFRIKETLANNSPVQAPKVSKTPTIVHKKVS